MVPMRMGEAFVSGFAGFAVGVLARWLLRSRRGEVGLERNARLFFVVVATVYPAIAWWNGLSTLPLETVTAIAAVALLLMERRWVWLVSVAFVCHAGWDFVHRGEPFSAHVPAWYPLFCATLDVTVAALLVLHWLNSSSREAARRGEGS